MEIRDLTAALAARDALAARAWMLDARRCGFDRSAVELPQGVGEVELAIAAAVVELVAGREGAVPPAWTASVPALSVAVYLVKAAGTMPRLRRLCEEQGPEPLRRRKLFAPPEFLTAA